MTLSTSQPLSSPIYADRSSGEHYPDAKQMVNVYLKRFAERVQLRDEKGQPHAPSLDASGFAEIEQGRAVIGINVLEEQGVLMVFAPILRVATIAREALYRRLLELSFLATADAAFAINAARNEVVVRCLRRLSALDYEELEDILATVGQVADHWEHELRREFGV